MLDEWPFQAQVAEISPGLYSLLLEGKHFRAQVSSSSEAPRAGADGSAIRCSVQVDGAFYSITVRDPRRWRRGRGAEVREGRQQIIAPMPGKVVRVLVVQGQRVEAGQGLIVVEAMKMQNEIKTPAAGTVEKLLVGEGQSVTAAQPLLLIE